ncbi:MAG TPA: GNAT family N-acetyltransferase [Phenylobacterium sp.]|jgi:predicted acetyltransferase|uniref:GNAT family N-acetyltransferase n=1 Tax=Phenylobacterium sp. TaxID=1871053 RepID=UPI002D4A322C|nr:GNAT family N-acetyltransferase [Phenylobacterium sp.]HZZ69784.1 GNAT family N-acetyltransferase [Phenylobacterium sp.]
MAVVTLEIARADQKPTLENLFQLYTHDFSDFWAGRAKGELQEDGRFAPYVWLDSYWTDGDRTPYLIRADGHVAGFALINRFSHSGLPLDFAVAEFFVVRKHRRDGVGFAAATQIIRARPGLWELAVARRNTGALPFWRKVASAIAGPSVEEIDRDDDLWNGPIVRFRA